MAPICVCLIGSMGMLLLIVQYQLQTSIHHPMVGDGDGQPVEMRLGVINPPPNAIWRVLQHFVINYWLLLGKKNPFLLFCFPSCVSNDDLWDLINPLRHPTCTSRSASTESCGYPPTDFPTTTASPERITICCHSFSPLTTRWMVVEFVDRWYSTIIPWKSWKARTKEP